MNTNRLDLTNLDVGGMGGFFQCEPKTNRYNAVKISRYFKYTDSLGRVHRGKPGDYLLIDDNKQKHIVEESDFKCMYAKVREEKSEEVWNQFPEVWPEHAGNYIIRLKDGSVTTAVFQFMNIGNHRKCIWNGYDERTVVEWREDLRNG